MDSVREVPDHWVRAVGTGTAAGVVAYLLGYGVLYLRTADSAGADIRRLLSGLSGYGGQLQPPSAWQVVGWIQYAAHNVDIVATVSGFGRTSQQTLPLTEGVLWERWFVLVPVLVLVLAGFAVSFVASAPDARTGLRWGSCVVVGYGPIAVAGTVLTTWRVSVSYGGLSASGSIGPALLWSMLLAGVAYPIVLGAVGGSIAGAIQGE